MNKNISTIIWSLITTALFAICAFEYNALAYNLQSVYDEGFFYVTSVFAHQPIADTQPLTLAQDAINALIPNIQQYDVLSLRQYAFWVKSIALIFLIGCSCLYVFWQHKEKRPHVYLAIIASYLLLGTHLLPGDLFNMNDVILILVTISFALCLLCSFASRPHIRYAGVVLIGIVAMFMLLCNLPAGCMMIALCGLFLVLDDGYNNKKLLYVSLFGLLGLLIGLGLTHFFIISLQDCIEFLQKGITQTTSGGRASHHSLSRVFLVICFGFRDLTITTLILCGITYICKIVFENSKKHWGVIVTLLSLFFIVYKWQVRPNITIASILCWFTIVFLNYHWKYNELTRKELLLILFSFIMPIGLVFGTNTSIIGKALACGTPWGFLVFYLYYLTKKELRKYSIIGLVIFACAILNMVSFSLIFGKKEQLHFEEEKPIARMNLTTQQKAFYDEVHSVLTDHGYVGGKDTLLGFCFNEMTVVAMDAVPYTNDQQPEEFILHDLENLPEPKYMIFSEWDSIVLYNQLSDLNWDFPDGYDYYKCTNNPDPNSGYNMTQSMIYCKKNRMMHIPFNKPHLTGKEAHYMYQAVYNGKLSGNGEFTKHCQHFFEERYGFKKCLLTTSGTDALEMCAMLCDLKPGDEVIVPSYTFVSTALAFLREGAKVIFADSMKRNPNLDAETLEALITPRTKVIVPVHYAGVACDMDAIMSVAQKHNLLVVEDAAQAIDSYYISSIKHQTLPLGGIGHLAAFSFHETKNITAGGEGGLLVVNDERFVRRAEIIWEKGTNRAEFFRGEVNKYGWVDMGSSFLPAEINAAFLWAQLENLDEIQAKRKQLWNRYYELLKPLADKGCFSLPDIPEYATNNAHMFYLILPSLEARTALIKCLKDNGVLAVFHYLSLHSSAYYADKHDGRALPECDRYADTLVRLPMYYDLQEDQVAGICKIIQNGALSCQKRV